MALTALAGVANAADLPRRAAPPPVFSPAPVFTWTGFYAGLNAGYGFETGDERGDLTYSYSGTPNAVFPGGAGLISLDNRRSADGFVGGAQIGYNHQFTPGSGVVVGIEADGQYIDVARRRQGFVDAGLSFDAPVAAGSRFYNPSGVGSLEFFGTARGRLGYAFDRALFYGTGGFAYASTDQDFKDSNTDDFRTGYVAGAGIEYALPADSFLNFFRSSAMTLKVEGLYVNLDRGNGNPVVGANGGTVIRLDDPSLGVVDTNTGASIAKGSLRRDTEFALVRAGVNYKFGSY